MNRGWSLIVALAMVNVPIVARAEDESHFNIPNGNLSRSLPVLSRQAGISISVADAKLWKLRVKSVRGRMRVAAAIRRMLEGSNARAVQISATSWRIELLPQKVKIERRATSPPPPLLGSDARDTRDNLIAGPNDEIIVTASKTDIPYANFAGVATVLDGDDLAFGGERGMDSILARTATISSTHLGSGRNKLFIRGIADSSFTGPTQATVGQYLGDVRLSYNAPDPDLRLYDIANVEILEGPQGTLYGAGSLGGVIRLIPNTPDPDQRTVQASAGVSLTQHGDPGGDVGVVTNLPIGKNGHALRLVGYMLTDGGYIDNPLLGQNDVNRVHVRGGRATFRFDPGDDWIVEIGGVYQSIRSNDAQYADKDAPPLVRNSIIEQNSKATYGMGTIVVTRDWADLHLQSSSAYVDHHLVERFDATRADKIPRALEQRNDTRLFTNETRLSRLFQNGLGWVIGVSVVDNQTRQGRELGGTFSRSALSGVTNKITEFTGYAEATAEILPRLIASAGARVSHGRLNGSGEDVSFAVALAGREITAHRTETDLLPSASLLWSPIEDVTLYGRYQEGFRPGGLAVERDFVRRFRNDQTQTIEGGVRFGQRGKTPLDASISVSHTRWRDIQADFIDGDGFPTTANIGDGRITSIAGALAVRLTRDLSIELGAVFNHSRVDRLSPQIAEILSNPATPSTSPLLPYFFFQPEERLGRIPNVANRAIRGSFDYAVFTGDEEFRVNGWANYIGPSRLGIGPVLGEGQGDYIDTGLAMRLGNPRRGVSITLTNLFDSRGNRFALGTPFVDDSAGFLTPLRPRTIRVAIDLAY